LIIAAIKASTLEQKSAYLSNIDATWNHVEDWKDLLKTDELKFCLAYLYHSLKQQDKSQQCLNNIADLFTLIRNKNQPAFTEAALIMLEDSDKVQYQNLMAEARCGTLEIRDAVLFNDAIQLILNRAFEEASHFMKNVRNFAGIHTIRAYLTFESSSREELLCTLEQLIQESTECRGLIFWHILYDLLKICLLKLSPDQKNNAFKISGLLHICANKIQNFEISAALKSETNHMLQESSLFIKKYIVGYLPQPGFFSVSEELISAEVEKHLTWSRQCIGSDDLYTVFSTIFASIADNHEEESNNFFMICS
jgi:hypothetical protein